MDDQLPFLQQVYPSNDFIEFKREEIEQPIAARFEAQVAQYPDRLALRAGGKGDAGDKIEAMKQAGIQVADSPASQGSAMLKAMGR